MFQPVSSKVNFPQSEERILRFWEEKDIFHKSVENRRGGKRFALYEGPPTANGNPGIHHVLTRVFKDVLPRYKTMKGYYAPRRAGWDTHGLPVELEVEKELGLQSKAQIEEYGVARFNARCRESVFRYLKEWEAMTRRIGFWLDLEHPYVTLDNSYIESCWWVIKQLWDKGLIYQGFKVTPHCPRCGTSLSSHEVALGYKDDAVDPSIYIRFRLRTDLQFIGDPGAREGLKKLGWDEQHVRWQNERPSLLVWTTTPWTLTANMAVAIAPSETYVLVEAASPQGVIERLILAKARLEAMLGTKVKRVLAEIPGSELFGIYYEPVYPLAALPNHFYRVLHADFVSMEEGTGIVHIAPAYGEEDLELGRRYGMEVVHTVNLDGTLKESVHCGGGKFVKDADPLILEDLKNRGFLYRSERITHTYPFCWRCDTPLLYYAKPSWYIRTTAKKDRLLENNEKINWYPGYIKNGRFGEWLENNVDWAFSRERYWGTPLPLWRCPSCNWIECIGSLEELKGKPEAKGLENLSDLHRPFIDEVTFSCPKCGSPMRRVPEVIDCWFDSGAMPVAQWHYPFENQEEFQATFPADFICEAIDQTRGWFYSLHALSTLLFDRPCYRNVICLGHILDAQGEKMSKARGNVVEPKKVLDSLGADALRWYLLTSTAPGNVRRFSTEQVTELVRKFLLTLWNTYSFFVTYANIDRYQPASAPPDSLAELDRWILSELHQLIEEVTTALDSYDPTEAGRKIEGFVENLSNWYVRRSRRRFWKSENDADKLAAYSTLYDCLVSLSRLLAPLAPFIAEELYQNLVRSVNPQAPESVHLMDFPIADASKIDSALTADTRLAMKVSSLGRAARAKAGIKVRQPLAQVLVRARSAGEREALLRLTPQVLEELNVKSLGFLDTAPLEGFTLVEEGDHQVAVDLRLTPQLVEEGLARELVHLLQTMRRKAGFDIADYIVTSYQGEEPLKQVMRSFAAYIQQETLSRQLVEAPAAPGAYTEKHRLQGKEVVLGVKKLG